MLKFCFLDFEGYSEADIKKVGSALYAEHPSTDLLVVGFAEDDGPVDTSLRYFAGKDRDGFWYSNIGDWNCENESAITLYNLALNQYVYFVAHNVAFERYMWTNHMSKLYGYPEIPADRWVDTMAMAYNHGLPGSLGGCASALHLDNQKDERGKFLINILCKPVRNKRNTPDTNPVEFEELAEYCEGDIIVMREIFHYLRPLSKFERAVWLIDRRINEEGLRLDMPLVHRANEIRVMEEERALAEFQEMTGLRPKQTDKLKKWFKEQGFTIPNCAKATMLKLSRDRRTPNSIRKVCEARIGAAAASLAKFKRAVEVSTIDGIVREWARYYASHLGRFTSGDLQFHNMMRPKVNTDTCADILLNCSIEDFYWFYSGKINEALGSTVRGAVIPPDGKEFYVADYAQIESRVLAWLAGEQWKLDKFIAKEDVYCLVASTIWGRTITKDQKEDRQVGKVGDLSLGYQGGIRAFANMAKQYDCDIAPIYPSLWASSTFEERESAVRHYQIYLSKYDEDLANGEPPVSKEIGYASNIIKERWRAGHPRVAGYKDGEKFIDGYWQKLEAAAITAALTGAPQTVCMGAANSAVTYFMDGIFLYCKVPSGGHIVYPYPKVEFDKRGGAKLSYRKMHQGKWIRRATYGGSLCENIVQRVARDLLCAAIIRLESEYPVCLHVHDEVVSAVKAGLGRIDRYEEIVKKAPKWSAGIPIEVESFTCKRYRK